MEGIREGSKKMEMKKRYTNINVCTNTRKSVLIDAELHRLLKIKAATEKVSLKVLLEGVLAELLSVEGIKKN